MDSLVIRYQTDVPTDGRAGAGHVFVVRDIAGEPLVYVSVRLDHSGRAELSSRYVDRAIPTNFQEVVDRVLLTYAVRRLESVLSDPSGRAELLESNVAWNLGTGDVDELVTLLDKNSAYQVVAGRDWYCSASSTNDPTAVDSQGLTVLAPTSRRLCQTCDLPDANYLCSHLMHPEVVGMTAGAEGGVVTRQLRDAMCDLGRDEIAQPGRCHAGGHPCWGRVVAPVETTPVELPQSALADAIDMLEAAWRLAFGKSQRLLALRSTVDTAGLEQSAPDRDAFRARIENLADVFMNMQVGESLIPADTPQQDRSPSLNRMQTVLASELADADRARDLVSPLRQIVGLRRALTHSPAASEIPSRADALGITWPPADWGAAWARVKATTVEALRALRHELVRLADDT